MTALAVMKDVNSALQALLGEANLLSVLEVAEDVERLKKKARSGENSHFSTVADAVAQTPWFKQQMQEFSQTVAITKVHKKKVLEISTWVRSPVADWKPEMIVENMRDLIFLQSDLPAGALDDMVKEGKAKIKEYWTSTFGKLVDGHAGVECKLLQDVVAEGCSSWPDDNFFFESTEKLADMMSSRAGQALVHRFLLEWSKLTETEQALDVEKLEAVLPDLSVHYWSARGVAMPQEERAKFDKVLEALLQKMRSVVGQDLQHFSLLCKASLCSESWWSTEQAETIRFVQAQHGLFTIMLEYSGGGVDVGTALGKPNGRANLGFLMRKVKECELLMKEPECPGWSRALLSPAFEKASGLVAESSNYLYAKVEENLSWALQSCTISKGLPDNKAWTDGVDDKMSWEALVQHGEKTLATVPRIALEEAEASLTKEPGLA